MRSGEEAKKMFEQTNCDGIMISRASLGNPWIFENVKNYLQEKPERTISKKEKMNIILEHIELETEEKGENTGVKEMRKNIGFYLKGEKDASKIREKINHLDTKDEVIKEIKEYFENLN